jgi:rare lipoprotein A (peptidoglycan hydrolase)
MVFMFAALTWSSMPAAADELLPACRTTTGSQARLLSATYYHPSLVGEQMANGRYYDPRNPTIAASNSYPLGTVLRVRHLHSTAYLDVEVMDRGSDDLDLDLSEAGFARLAPLVVGRVAVCAEIIRR